MRLLDDNDVDRLISPSLAVEAMRETVRKAYEGAVDAPPRLSVPLGPIGLVFTAGAVRGGPVGFRAYGLWPGDSDQLVAVWDPVGKLTGLVVGARLGRYRTGALGGVALDALAPDPLGVLAVVGTGRQAWAQLWAATAVRAPAEVRVAGRDPDRLAAFVRRATVELRLPATAVTSVRDAVAGAGSVIVATTSRTPVLAAEWLPTDCHVTTVGPKFTDDAELPAELVREAAVVVSDGPAQIAAIAAPSFAAVPVVHLGAVLAGAATVPAGIRVFVSAGLAGTEVVLADRLLASE
jgi:ornithine cyclodeaminase/alanine dehydrogenase-like protein (mu-crystallin family)